MDWRDQDCCTCEHFKPQGGFQMGFCTKFDVEVGAGQVCEAWTEAEDYPTVSKER